MPIGAEGSVFEARRLMELMEEERCRIVLIVHDTPNAFTKDWSALSAYLRPSKSVDR